MGFDPKPATVKCSNYFFRSHVSTPDLGRDEIVQFYLHCGFFEVLQLFAFWSSVLSRHWQLHYFNISFKRCQIIDVLFEIRQTTGAIIVPDVWKI